ncbi:Hypothetical predicted protein [Mytilus galloprovincialis]|uniref:Integrase zinc-binding domain-containing protein n=1 Tax=Mytilus galloprovincialis TaxID=29158 RepID=A0A8B6GKY5_MYTGA|nr:Hypothetical predicted protein [Mytilus galloprovincialis]
MNTELDPKTIYPGTTIAQMSGVEQVLDEKETETKDQYDTVNAITRFDDSNDKDDDSEHHDLSLKEIQKNDHDLKIVTKWVETDERPDYKDISDKGFFLRSLWNQWNNLELRDGLIYRRFEDPATKIVKMQAIIPLSERKKVLQFSHDDKCSAHLGIHKTLAKIRQSYYWPGLQNDVRTYINGCDKCAKRKSPQKSKRAPMALVEANGPMERIATDILGELPETESGNKYILVVSDYYTKWTESFAMPNMEAKTVAKIIVEEVITLKMIQLKTTIETPYSQDIAVHESTLPEEETQEISYEGRRTRRKPAWMADYIVK